MTRARLPSSGKVVTQTRVSIATVEAIATVANRPGTKAIDIACERCGADVGERCHGHAYCSERIRLAGAITRVANRRAKSGA